MERERVENSAVASGVSGPEDGAKPSLATLLSLASPARSSVWGDPGGSAWSGGSRSLWTGWSTEVGVAMLSR